MASVFARPPIASAWPCAVVVLMTLTAPAAAQVRLAWPDVPVRLERYATQEECLAVVARVRDSVAAAEPVWRDTLPLTPAEATAPLPAPVVEVARQCGARLFAAIDTVPRADFGGLLQLTLLANRDADAQRIATRWLEAVGPKSSSERAAVLDSIAAAYLGAPYNDLKALQAQPVRFAPSEPLLRELGAMDPAHAPWHMRLGAYARLVQTARAAGDTVRMLQAAEAVKSVTMSLSAAERRRDNFNQSAHAAYQALRILTERALQDSLRQGTAGYVALLKQHWTTASGEAPEALKFPIGQPAPALTGDFWFGRGDSSATRPTKGKIAFVVFVDQALCAQTGCWTLYSALRRLGTRYPELEITLVSRTLGHMGDLAPPSPSEEADTLRSQWLERQRIPAALAVTATDFWRLPAPDRRRVDRDRPNEVRYTFDRRWKVNSGVGYLVDRRGTIVDLSDLADRTEEARLHGLLDALFAQQVAAQ